MNKELTFTCPLPGLDRQTIKLAHGGGGLLMHQLLDNIFLPAFRNEYLNAQHDGAVFRISEARLAFTTDSYVIHPLFFPGGDIGRLAIYGTVNDLAMCGARPLYLSAGFIMEEGLAVETVQKVARSMQEAARAAAVQLITGDTKVVEKGKGDGLYINTSGVGILEHDMLIEPAQVQPGDAVLLSGDLGRHGTAIMATREGLEFETTITSDCASLSAMVQNLLGSGVRVHCLRDLTRGGLASALVEIAQRASVHIHLEGRAIPVSEEVRGACEILGLDPLYVANEGRLVAFVPESDADAALTCLRRDPAGARACRVGNVEKDRTGLVSLRSEIGVDRMVDMLSGEQLPRIC